MNLTKKEWKKKYKPIENGTTFDNAGSDRDKMTEYLKNHPNTLWTEIDGDDGTETFILPGYHFVNRLWHYLTEIPYENTDVFVISSDEEDWIG
jgi:hypothetical protein